MQNLSRLEQILLSTYRISGRHEDGETQFTGFLYKQLDAEERWTDYLITNRHNLEDCLSVAFEVRRRQSAEPFLKGDFASIEAGINQSEVLYHPDHDVDLAALNISFALAKVASEDGAYPLVFAFSNENIPFGEKQHRLDIGMELLVLGATEGVNDDFNRLTIARRAIAASHPQFPFNGNEKFLIDAPTLAGSSGSPVISWSSLEPNRGKSRYDLLLEPRGDLVGIVSHGMVVRDGARAVDLEADEGRHIDLGVAVSSKEINRLFDWLC